MSTQRNQDPSTPAGGKATEQSGRGQRVKRHSRKAQEIINDSPSGSSSAPQTPTSAGRILDSAATPASRTRASTRRVVSGRNRSTLPIATLHITASATSPSPTPSTATASRPPGVVPTTSEAPKFSQTRTSNISQNNSANSTPSDRHSYAQQTILQQIVMARSGRKSNSSSWSGTARNQTPDDTGLPSFSADKLIIYQWPPPGPRSFSKLSESNKRWKAKKDAEEKSSDIDDGADDWDEFAGDRSLYPEATGLEYAIASSFVKRAKRAFWSGTSWEDYAAQELAIDSQSAANAESDPKRRELLLEYSLDNDLRIAIFDKLKVRLCNEIWSMELPRDWVERADSRIE